MRKKSSMQAFRSYELSDAWFVRQKDEENEEWLSCTVPTNIHLDLLAHGKIPDPYLQKNELDIQWVGEKSWTYKTTLPKVDGNPSTKYILALDGLDTFATVKVNGTEYLKSSNMFVAHRVDITDVYDPAKDITLEIDFHSALLEGRRLQQHHPNHKWLCSNGEPSRLAVRKAQYHWGWDWGPTIVTGGPWKSVRLEAYQARLAALEVETTLTDDLETGEIIPLTRVDQQDVTSDMHVEYMLECGGEVIAESVVFADPEKQYYTSETFVIDEPLLWYPRGYGEQTMYTVHAVLYTIGGVELHRLKQRVGLRKAELITEKDSHGQSFYFRCNNIDIFCGGSNWIPADMFPPRVSREKYKRWLKLVTEGNQVMIRVWGGGYYEDNSFYETCDELGILVWQDFMFACGNYPVNSKMISDIEDECNTQLDRFQHHPSIVMCVGNNEDYQIPEQFQLEYDPFDENPDNWLKTDFPARYIYERLIPEQIKNPLSNCPYRYGSPWCKGKATGNPRYGDQHQWNVWHGTQEKYQLFDKLGGRFVSEFGMEAYPHIQTIREFCPDETELYPGSATLDFHNKAAGHERRVATYVAENFRVRSDLEGHIYLTQLVQSEAMMYAYRGFRRQWGHNRKCGGALVWQLNDCWPGISWAICDYSLRKKPAYYAITRALAPLVIGIQREHYDWSVAHARPPKTSEYQLWVASSKLRHVEAAVELRFISVKTGAEIKDTVKFEKVKVEPNGTSYLTSGTIDNEHDEPHVLAARLTVDGEVVSRDTDWPQPFKYLSFENRGLKVEFDGKEQITIKSEKPVKGLVFEERDGVVLGDNALDVVPGDDQVVKLSGFPEGGEPLGWRHLGTE